MNKPSIAVLHYTSPPIIGGVEYTIAAHGRLLADHGYPVKIIAGRGGPLDPRVPVRIVPSIDSKDRSVLKVNEHLAQGILTAEFHSLVATTSSALTDALADADVCIVHNALSLHKNLALTQALHNLAATRQTRLIAWCHDFAWDDPLYIGDMHPGMPWDLLRTRWDRVQYVVVSQARRSELARLLSTPERDIAVVPPGVDAISFLGIGESADRWAREFGLLEAQPLLLLPARVTRRKNIELAIEITAALQGQGLHPKLVVMGPLGPHNPANARYLEELRTLNRDRGVEQAVVFLSDTDSPFPQRVQGRTVLTNSKSPSPLAPLPAGERGSLRSGEWEWLRHSHSPESSHPRPAKSGEGAGGGESRTSKGPAFEPQPREGQGEGANDGPQVDDAARRDLYLLADALLFTSEREGFGIPVLEAGLARLPVFCSDIPPFHESAGQWAHYFALDQSPVEIARLISECLDSDARYRLKRRVLHEYAWPRIFTESIEPLLKE